MLAWIQEQLQELAEARKVQQQSDGYCYAAGRLLSSGGDLSVMEELEQQADCAFDPGHPFDRGILAAVRDWALREETIRAKTR